MDSSERLRPRGTTCASLQVCRLPFTSIRATPPVQEFMSAGRSHRFCYGSKGAWRYEVHITSQDQTDDGCVRVASSPFGWFRSGFLRSLGMVTLIMFLVSCVTGPDYNRPGFCTPDHFKSATAGETAQPALGQDWWRLFNDANLNELVEEALQANQNLKAAMARVAQSRAAAASVKGAFFPIVTLDPSALRSRSPGGDGSVPATTGSRLHIPFDLSYEIDIWGRVKRSLESAQAQAMASVYALAVVRQTLIADLARNYFSVRSFDAQYQILMKNLGLYQEQVELTETQFKAGLVSNINVQQAKVQLESTRAQAADIQRQRADLEHAIAVLLGRAPSEFSLEFKPLEGSPLLIPAGLPSDLLRRRPDVAGAEQNLISACAEIGVAQAEFYPSVKLTGATGFQSADIKSVLDWCNRVWSFGPSISLPIFKGGQLKAKLEKAKARYDELEATYRNAVLMAFSDVEDSLTDLHFRADAAEAQANAVNAAREYLRLTQIEYKSGVIDYLHVVNAEQTLMTNELSEAQMLSQRMISTVLLIKALGGGWDPQVIVHSDAEKP